MSVKAELLSAKASLRGPFVRNQEQDHQMSKKATKTKCR